MSEIKGVPETKLREERGLSGCRKGLKTVLLAQALLSLKNKNDKKEYLQFLATCWFFIIKMLSNLTMHYIAIFVL